MPFKNKDIEMYKYMERDSCCVKGKEQETRLFVNKDSFLCLSLGYKYIYLVGAYKYVCVHIHIINDEVVASE